MIYQNIKSVIIRIGKKKKRHKFSMTLTDPFGKKCQVKLEQNRNLQKDLKNKGKLEADS